MRALAEHFGQPCALQRVEQFRVLGEHVRGQAAFAPKVVVRVLMRRDDEAGIDLQPFGETAGEVGGLGWGGAVVVGLGMFDHRSLGVGLTHDLERTVAGKAP